MEGETDVFGKGSIQCLKTIGFINVMTIKLLSGYYILIVLLHFCVDSGISQSSS